jgi:hypothetical protein
MANKYMKKCLMSLVIKEMQIKMMLRFHLSPVRMAVIKKTAHKCWKRHSSWRKNYHTLVTEMQISTVILGISMEVPRKIKNSQLLWLTLIVLAAPKTQIGRIEVQGQPMQNIQETPISNIKNWAWGCLPVIPPLREAYVGRSWFRLAPSKKAQDPVPNPGFKFKPSIVQKRKKHNNLKIELPCDRVIPLLAHTKETPTHPCL